MPRNCIYPQNTDVNEFLDDGKTPNPARCPYRTRWKPYTTPANNRCCQKAHVRPGPPPTIEGYGGVPATHVNFSDEKPPRRPPALQNPRSCINQNKSACDRNRRCNYDENHNVCEPIKWKPNQNCPGESICTDWTCVPKIGPSGPRARGCSDKYRCVLKEGAAWRRSCREVVPGKPPHEEELKEDIEEKAKPLIKKVTHRRKGCNEFPELNEGEPEPRGWCPVQRCYRHVEAGKRVCSADDIGEEGDGASDWSVDLFGDADSSDDERDEGPQGGGEIFEEEKQEYVMPDLESPSSSDDDSSDDEPYLFDY